MIMVPHLVVGLAVRVQNLTLDTRLHGILGVADAKIHATVSPFGILVFDLEDEVLVFFFRGQVVVVALPSLFSGSWVG